MCCSATVLYLKLPLDRIECGLDLLADDDWMVTGVSSRTIVNLGHRHGMNVYIMAGGRTISQHKHEKRGNRACLCFAVEGDHAWFYDSESVRRSIAHLNVSSNESVSTRAMVAHDCESTRTGYRTWQEWYRGETNPGCYDT